MNCAEARPLLSARLDGAQGETAALAAHLSACAACRALQDALAEEHQLLGELWPPVAAPPDFAQRVAAALPPRRRAERRWLAAAAVLAVLLAGSALLQPTAWASLGLLLRQVALRESPPPESFRTQPLRQLSLDEAQRLVPWRIRQPVALPDGYRLVAVYAGELHAFAVGPTVVLRYQHGEGPQARHLELVELRAAGEVSEPVAQGAARQVRVGEGTGLLIDGRWAERDGERVWERGTLLRLIVEQGDLAVQLQADPRDGWDAERLAAVAASLR